jgi:hypothetical protein
LRSHVDICLDQLGGSLFAIFVAIPKDQLSGSLLVIIVAVLKDQFMYCFMN